MDKTIVINLIYNITILLALALIYSSFHYKDRKDSIFYKIMLGFFIGTAGLQRKTIEKCFIPKE